MTCSYKVACFLLGFLLFESYAFATEKSFRQKRCIVVQKQSGTHGDSTEDGGGDEDRSSEPRDFKPHRKRVQDPLENIHHDVEVKQLLFIKNKYKRENVYLK
ncbi:unnamed protein product [Parnassius apollo]|uniref:(apollo) hypothetical protein n=1 Tax=Parnassius apollo TaxID=110799 RepID=A0A8S3WEN1_PARAO|nr:unnamed protein product [Parnassius apollo]